MKKTLALLNLLSVIIVIFVNYLSQSLRFNNTTIGELSNQHNNLFTPAGYAFAIWGLIFFSLLGYAAFQIRRVFFSTKSSDFVVETGYWFCIANVLNASWVVAFVYDYTALSVCIMVGILYALLKIILNTNMERWDAPLPIIAFVWWPICLYSGWITVATIANIATYLTKIEWSRFGISEDQWTIVMIIIAMVINLLMIMRRNMREFALVGIWAIFAIYIRHKDTYEMIAITAATCCIILLATCIAHGYQNRATNPLKKYIERQKKS